MSGKGGGCVGQRVGYAFVPAPMVLTPKWHGVSFYARAMGGELFRVTRGEWVEHPADWQTSLCKLLSIDGSERPAAKRALKQLADNGLIVLSGGRLRVLFGDQIGAENLRSGPTEVQLRSNSGPTEVQLRSDVTVENDSGHVLQIERKKERSPNPSEEGERKEPKNTPLPASFRSTFERAYLEARGTFPTMTSRHEHGFADRVRATAAAQGADPHSLFASAVSKWLARSHGETERKFPWAAFVQAWAELTAVKRAPVHVDVGW